MGSRLYTILLLILMCTSIFGAVDSKTSSALYAEINKMLNDDQAFPQGSEQYQELLKFKRNLAGILGSARVDTSIQQQQSSFPASTNMGMSSPTTGMMGSRFSQQMRHHRELSAELNKVRSLHQNVNQKLQDLQSQLAVIKQYNQDIKEGKDVGEDYDQAMGKYQQDHQEYKQMQQEYHDALNTYNQHQQAYRSQWGY